MSTFHKIKKRQLQMQEIWLAFP